MKKFTAFNLVALLCIIANLLADTYNAGAQQSAQTKGGQSNSLKLQVISVSPLSVTKSGMVKIKVANLSSDKNLKVKIGNADAIISSLNSDTITAYISENASEGKNKLQVLSNNAVSNDVELKVVNRTAAGRELWKFLADDSYIQGRVGIGADGTIYALGIQGHLYALTPQGALKWIYTAVYGSVQSVSVGNDGAIYFAGLNTVYAINPNGTLKWTVSNPQFGSIVAGPNVGPDGNIYAVAENPGNSGLGAISITPSGVLRWNKLGYVVPRTAVGQTKEIVFSAGQLYFNLNRIDAISGLQALNMSNGDRVWTGAGGTRQPAVAPDGRIYTISAELANSYAEISSFTTSGSLIKKYFGNGTKDLSSPDVGSDGIFYTGRNYQYLVAENPDGTQKFSLTAKAYIGSPIVSPQNSLVVVGGSQSFAPGYVGAASTSGVFRWAVLLSLGNGNYATPLSRPTFSNDGSAVYIGTALNYTSSSCYLYALSTATNFADKSAVEFIESKSLQTKKTESEFTFYPNPARDIIHLKVDGKKNITVTSNTGKVYISKFIDGSGDIIISSLPEGIYVISNEPASAGKKLIVQK